MGLISTLLRRNSPEPKPVELTKRATFTEAGATGTVYFSGILSGEEYNNDLAGDSAIRVYDKMWRGDGQVAATVRVCTLPLLEANWSIPPASENTQDVEIAQFVNDNLMHGMQWSWHATLNNILLSTYVFGFSVNEKVWIVGDDGKVRLRKLAPRLARSIYRWYPNQNDELDRITQIVFQPTKDGMSGAYEYVDIDAEKLSIFTLNRIGNNFQGVSLLRHAYPHYFYKQQLYRIDAIAAERNGLGTPMMEEPPGVVQKSDRDAAAAVLSSFHAHEKGYVQVPNGWKFSLVGVTGGVRDIMPSIQHHDLLIARSVLAQFINLDSGGTLIAARDSSSFFLQGLHSVAVMVAGEINKVIRELVDYNWAGVARYPTIQVSDLDKRDIENYLRGLAGMFAANAITNNAETENAIREMLNLPALPNEPTLGAPAQTTVDAESQGQAAAEGGRGELTRKARHVARLGQPVTVKLAPPTRELRPLERHADLAAMNGTIDKAKAALAAAAHAVMLRQLAAMLKVARGYVQRGQHVNVEKVDVPFGSELVSVLYDALKAQYQAGRSQVRAELASQRGHHLGLAPALRETDATVDLYIREQARASARIFIAKLKAGFADGVNRQMIRGQFDAGVLEAALVQSTGRDLIQSVGGLLLNVLNAGRDREAVTQGAEMAEFSSVLDANSCDPCSEADGTQCLVGSDEYDRLQPPYSACDGGDSCRCVWLFGLGDPSEAE